jgi:hypothetical protein
LALGLDVRLHQFQVPGLGDREGDLDRVHAVDGRQHAGLRTDQIADIEGGEVDATSDGGDDLGVVDIELGLFDIGLGGLHRGLLHQHLGLGLVDLLLADVLGLGQFLVAGQVDLGAVQRGIGRGQLRLGLGQGRLILLRARS